MSTSHKVVAYPLSSLRQQRLLADGAAMNTFNFSGSTQTDTNVRESNLHPNTNKGSSHSPNNPRSRSLSAGRTRQSTSDIVQDVYDRLGVNRADLSACDENLSAQKKTDGARPSPLADKFSSRYQDTANPGRGRQQAVSASTTESPESQQRRSRSLSRGRVANTQWPPLQATNEQSHLQVQRTYRNTANGIVNNSFANNLKPALKSDWKDEKKLENDDCNEIKPASSQECEDQILRVTPPSVKDRSRIYGGSLSDQSSKAKNNKRSNTVHSTVDPTYASHTGNKSHPPKIKIFREDDDDQRSACNTVISKQRSIKGDNQTTTIPDSSPSNRKNGSLANAFLASITPTKSTPTNKTLQMKQNFKPVLEIQTSSGDDNDGTSNDTISISMSSVSADEFSKSVDHVGLSPSIHSHSTNNLQTTTQQVNGMNSASSLNRLKGPSSSDNKKVTSWHEKNRLPPFNSSNSIASKGKSFEFASPRYHERASFQQAPTPTHQNGCFQSTPDSLITSSRIQAIIDERVNARMSEYEARMEKMILKFLQTVDEKMSARMSTVEGKISSVSAALAELNSQRQQQK